jgi:hypothetical protein
MALLDQVAAHRTERAAVSALPSRCTPPRKHVKEKGKTFCDCGALMVGLTAAKNAVVVTVLDDVQRDAIKSMETKA